MPEPSPLILLAQARQQLRALCDKKRFAAAEMYLTGAGCGAADFPGLWEYLARASRAAGDEAVAHKVRMELRQADHISRHLMLDEAEYYLGQEDTSSAVFLVKSGFGDMPADRRARHLLARCYLQETMAETTAQRTRVHVDRDLAIRLNQDYSLETPQEAATIIDLLRFSGALDLAAARNAEARKRFPGQPRFLRRQASILEQMRDPAGAIAVWTDISAQGGPQVVEALFKLHQLNRWLGHEDAASRAAASLATRKLDLPDRMRLAIVTRQDAMVRSLARHAVYGRARLGTLDHGDGVRITDLLLENGHIGLVVWLRRNRIAVSARTKSVLARCGFGNGGHRPLPGNVEEAAALRSPEFMLPLDRFLDRHAKPVGWPGERQVPGRILLVNGTLGAGGAERQFVELVRALIRAGLSPDQLDCGFFSLEASRAFDRFLPDLQALGVPVHDMRMRPRASVALPDRVETVIDALPFELREDVLALWHLVTELRPDTIHAWQDRSGLAAGIVGDLTDTERVIMSARNLAPPSRGDLRLTGFEALYRDFLDHQNYVMTANSKQGADDYAEWLGTDAGEIALLRNSVDFDRFSPAVRRGPRRSADLPIRIGGVFRLAAAKRPLLWLDIISTLRRDHALNLTPVLFGSGPMLHAVRDRADALGLDDLCLHTDMQAPQDIYGQIDLLLLVSRVEGLPNVLLEAQACGLPVAATDVGGAAEAMVARGAAGGLLLPETIDPATAAARLATWMPEAMAAPPGRRVSAIQRNFGPQTMSDAALSLYLGKVAEPA